MYTVYPLYIHQEEVIMNDAGFRVRVDNKLREEFIQVCKSNDLTAAQVIRSFMRSYIKEQKVTKRSNELISEQKFSNIEI
jgi:antitoxin component of RelBE/YafQ-DinJ toxin-antitoxin module